MNKIIYDHKCENRYPHAADVLEREFSEGGFAKGWAMHQKPVPDYYFDCHIHFCGESLVPEMDAAAALDVQRALAIVKIYGETPDGGIPAYVTKDQFPWFTPEGMKAFWDALQDNRFFWTAWLNHQDPDPNLICRVADAGAKIIKLHNAPVIEDNEPPDIWLSDQWQETFRTIGECCLPVIIHVTQRLPSSDYTGGGRNTYWSKGWENGVTYGNEDLLQVFLTCCRRHPNIPFIGAHQLHIGWERLDELFTEFPNLYVDTSIGCQLRLYDDFYPHDKEFLRQIFIKWADRIIFGTDCLWGADEPDTLFIRQHMRFITALDLPGDVLNKICHSNVERVCRIAPLGY